MGVGVRRVVVELEVGIVVCGIVLGVVVDVAGVDTCVGAELADCRVAVGVTDWFVAGVASVSTVKEVRRSTKAVAGVFGDA